MKETFLVQRLNKPIKKTGGPLDNAHRVLGGGMLQLSEKVWNVLDPIFTIDYMGSAEFEFGAIPNTLQGLLRDKEELCAFQFEIKAKDIRPSWDRTWAAQDARTAELKAAKEAGIKPKRAKKVKALKGRTVYVLCRKEHKEQVVDTIKRMAAGKQSLKDSAMFCEALDPTKDYHLKTQGWLELNNGFFFFVDEAMWKATTELFTLRIRKE